MAVKEGSPRKHTQSVQRPPPPAGPRSQQLFENSSGFTIKVKIYFFILTDRKICNGKNKGLALLDPFSYCFKMTLQKNVLLIDLRPCFHFYFSLLLQKTFLLIDLRPCFHFDDLLERCSIHLHYESNQSIEWMNRINEWKQWIEPMNRTNESNQWIESLSRETRQEAVTIHIRWLSKPVLESHHIDLLLWIPNPPSVRVFCWDNF